MNWEQFHKIIKLFPLFSFVSFFYQLISPLQAPHNDFEESLDYLLCDAFLKNSTTQFFNESGDSPSISSWTPSPSVIVIGPRCLVSNQVERFQNLYGSLFNDRFGNLIKSYFFHDLEVGILRSCSHNLIFVVIFP